MPTPDSDRATDRSSKRDSRSAGRSGARAGPAPIAFLPRAFVASGADKALSRRGRRTRRPVRLPSRVRFRLQVGLLEQRVVLSALPTLTALRASTASAALGQSVMFTATVGDLSAGGATPNEGTVTLAGSNNARRCRLTRHRDSTSKRAGLEIIPVASVLDTISALASFSALEGEIG
jgi:hypothetical protein